MSRDEVLQKLRAQASAVQALGIRVGATANRVF
ncbi:hypothetical protein J2S22_001816 [Rhodoplanes tepidamans]|nr:hypothetical protein [Rhodoplanes tepidamans]